MTIADKIEILKQASRKLLEAKRMLDSLGIKESDINIELENAFKEIKNCDHEWEEFGHDSHKDFKKCKKCGKIEEL